MLHEIEQIVGRYEVEILPEIHEHYTIPMKIAEKGFWVYDFALPVLTLHALYNHTGVYLKEVAGDVPNETIYNLGYS